jgi:hypothetical protein
MTIPIYSIKCRKCQKETYQSTFISDGITCDKKQCWLQCGKARDIMAETVGCDAVELLPAVEGKIKIHEEPSAPTPVIGANAEGRYIQGRWIPWGDSVNEYFD